MIYLLWVIKRFTKLYSAWARADCAGKCAFLKYGSNPHTTASRVHTGG